MANYLTSITNYLWTQSWQMVILAVIVAMLSILLRNKSAHIRYLLWLTLLAKCLVPPLLTVPLAILPQEQIAQPIIETAAKIPFVFVDSAETTIAEPVVPLPTSLAEPTIFGKLATVTLSQWLGFAWILGVVIFALVALMKALRVNHWLRRERRPLPADLQRSIRSLFAELSEEKFPMVWLVDGIGQPFVWGLLRGDIYLPSDFTEIKAEEHRRGILSHELSHVIRFDAAVNLLQIIAQVVFWFHPLIWWVNKRIRAEREKCCDEMAIAWLGTKAKDFSTAIVNILTAEHKSTQPISSLAVAGPVKNIEDRIKTIMNPSKKYYKRPSIVAAITILLFALIVVPTTLALTSQPTGKPHVTIEAPSETADINETEPIDPNIQALMSGSIHTNQTEKEKPMPTNINMPAPASDSGNTYARGMSAVLSYLGTDTSYDRVMGLTGVAFILQVDTSGPFVEGELDCGWWPNDAWGFDLGLPVLSKAVGWETRKIRCSAEAYRTDAAAEHNRAFSPAIQQSLTAGRPVLAEHDHCFIVTAVDNEELPLLGYGTRGKSTQFEDVIRIAGYPWGLIVFGEKTTPGNPEEIDLASLRHIIALWNEQAQGPDAPKTRFSGRQAWAEWLRLLRAGSACDNNMLIHLRYNRRSALAYLREMVKRHNGAAATHLSVAADLYQRIVNELMKQGMPYNRVKSGEDEHAVRAEYTAMVELVSELEAQAIAELEAAAASISAKP